MLLYHKALKVWPEASSNILASLAPSSYVCCQIYSLNEPSISWVYVVSYTTCWGLIWKDSMCAKLNWVFIKRLTYRDAMVASSVLDTHTWISAFLVSLPNSSAAHAHSCKFQAGCYIFYFKNLYCFFCCCCCCCNCCIFYAGIFQLVGVTNSTPALG